MDLRPKFSSSSLEYKSRIVPVFLSMIPGVFGLGVLIAAVVITSWMELSIAPRDAFQVQSFGLFSVCTTQVTNFDTVTTTTNCRTREEVANEGLVIDPLEQATRGLILISVILHVPGILAAIYFGLRRRARQYSPFIPFGIFALAATCAIAGMGCYSAFISQQSKNELANTYVRTVPGLSFLLGWFGTACALIASITAVVAYAIN